MSPRSSRLPSAVLPALVLTGAALLFPACTSSGPPTPGQPLGAADPGDLFVTLWEAYGDDLMRGDAAAVAAWFTHDAELMEPGRETLRGHDEIRGYLSDALRQFRVTEVRIQPDDVDVYGRMAYDMGTATETVEMRSDGSATTEWTVRYAAVWMEGSDGRWRIYRLLVSPLAGPSP